MKEQVMKAFYEGLADFVRAFWSAASKQGFAVMLLLLLCVALGYWVVQLNEKVDRLTLHHKEELAHLRNECRRDLAAMNQTIDSLQLAVIKCIQEKAELKANQRIILKRLKKLTYE